MKNIIEIFRDDLKDVFSNKSVLIILIGLSILPSLYAWFNIEASWDPYGNTSNIAVAVVNSDEGTTLFDKHINVGDEVVEKLKKQTGLGWKFVSSEEAKNGVETGKYYASIEITKDFSKDIVSILSENITKAKIVYTVNEKINAIAPKITDKGASTVQLQVNQTVIKTASESIFKILNELGIKLEENLPALTKIENSLKDVQSKFKDIDKVLDTVSEASTQVEKVVKVIQDNMPLIESTLQSSKELSGDVKEFLKTTKSSMNDIAPTIKNDLQIINDTSSAISSGINDLKTALQENYEKAPEIVDNLYNKVNNLLSISSTLGDFLNKINNIAQGNLLGNVIAKINTVTDKLQSASNILSTIKTQIDNGQVVSIDKVNSVIGVLNDVTNITGNILNNFDSQIVTPLNNIFDKGINVSNNVITLLQNAENTLPEVNNTLKSISKVTAETDKTIVYVKEKLPEAKSMLDELVTAISKVNNSKEMDELVKFLKNNIVEEANFVKEPVELVTNSLYPIANYGSAMTPFYTVLSVWVGMLLLSSVLTPEVHGDYKSYEIYFGRALMFLTIGLIQTFIVSMGDLYLLRITAKNPAIFVLLSLLTSIVFTFIVYSLVSVFGNLGKAFAIILLVIQVAGSGGTFPIEVTPEFFRKVNPFLPFTYAIAALREAVAGIYQPNLTKDITALLIFLLIAIVLNVILKRPINKVMSKFTEEMENSRLTEH